MHVHSQHQLLVEVVREPSGELLAQAGLDDLTHLVEEARYEAVSRGILPDEPQRLAARIEPIRGPSGSPCLEKVQVALWHDRAAQDVSFHEFPNAIARGLGLEQVTDLINAGILSEGDTYRV